MTSEIEIVDEVKESRVRDAGNGTIDEGVVDEEILRDDIYTAAAYGDLEKLERLVETEGCSVSQPDGLGYSALQWAALNNRAAAAQYIIQEKRREEEESEAQLNMQRAQEAAHAKLARDLSNELCEADMHLEELRETVVHKCSISS